jgi:hypothetical protein
MVESDNLRYTKIALNNGSDAIPALGFGTLIPDPIATRTATRRRWKPDFAFSTLRSAIVMKKGRTAMTCITMTLHQRVAVCYGARPQRLQFAATKCRKLAARSSFQATSHWSNVPKCWSRSV